METTIASIATAYGQGGIGIIRISGPKARPLANSIFRPHKPDHWQPPQTHRLVLGHIVHGGQVIDQVLCAYMKGPHSYTGEDVVEIHSHGGTLVQETILGIILGLGAQAAGPGDFSRRAFLNGKMDLIQAESILDIMEATNRKGLELAASHLSGSLTQRIERMAASLMKLIAGLEASLDFPDDEIQALALPDLKERVQAVQKDLKALIDSYQQGRMARKGVHTVIAGRPNVGKSSLLNALLGEDRAIVTHQAGTTRDTIEEVVQLKRLTLRITDTAGIRTSSDQIEQMGVDRSKKAMQAADLILLVTDLAQGKDPADLALEEEIRALGIPYLEVANKLDLVEESQPIGGQAKEGQPEQTIYLSAKKKQGLDQLEKAIEKKVSLQVDSLDKAGTVTRYRHYALLSQAEQALAAFLQAADQLPADFLSIDLRRAFEALEDILGRQADEDIFDLIFSDFCIGK